MFVLVCTCVLLCQRLRCAEGGVIKGQVRRCLLWQLREAKHHWSLTLPLYLCKNEWITVGVLSRARGGGSLQVAWSCFPTVACQSEGELCIISVFVSAAGYKSGYFSAVLTLFTGQYVPGGEWDGKTPSLSVHAPTAGTVPNTESVDLKVHLLQRFLQSAQPSLFRNRFNQSNSPSGVQYLWIFWAHNARHVPRLSGRGKKKNPISLFRGIGFDCILFYCS